MYGTAVLAAFGSAVGFAVATSLQHQATGGAPPEARGAFGLLRHLVTRPLWLLGQALATASFVLHATALHLGSLLVVQPVVLSGIVLAVPIRAALSRRRPPASEIAAVLVTAVGLTIFLVVAGDTTGSRTPGDLVTALVAVATVVVGASGYLLAGRGRTAAWRAGSYGAVAGLLFGVVSALVKLTLDRVSNGLDSPLEVWPALALACIGLFGVATNQTSYRVGSLSASMPVLNAVNVVVSLALGVAMFGEVPAHSTPDLLLESVALLAVLVGVVWSSAHAEPEPARSHPSAERQGTPSEAVGR